MGKRLTTDKFLETVYSARADKGSHYDYSKVEYIDTDTHICIICPTHGEFWQRPRDHRSGHNCYKCGKESAKQTCLIKYGVDNPYKCNELVELGMLRKHGVKNPSHMSGHTEKVRNTSIARYGVEWPTNNISAKRSRKETCIQKYGTEYPMQNSLVMERMMSTKLYNGSFDRSNSSFEATMYFRQYIKDKNYQLSQVAYADEELGLHEWGYYFDRWYLFDFVAFESGCRGDYSKILEIVEYHGPFHFSQNDVQSRGDEKAYPWKSKTITIKESYEIDIIKKKMAEENLTKNYTVVWAEKYHNKGK